MIERARPRGGVPAYNANDVYVLNGTELVACVSGMVSPSCSTGGTHATENESYNRIRYLAGPLQWEITDREGTKTLLSAVGTIANAGTLTPGTEEYNLAYQYRWLVTSVTDTHGNAVTYTYTCPELPTCYPNTITYNGSTIRFYREARPDYLLVANGRTLSTIATRVRTIAVLTGGVLRAAYGLEYDQAPVSGASRLVKIRQFGRDAAVNASGVISGGTERPQTVMSYRGFQVSFGASLSDPSSADLSYGTSFPSQVQFSAHDIDNDGASELLELKDYAGGVRVLSFEQDGTISHDAVLSLTGMPTPGGALVQGSFIGRFDVSKAEKDWVSIWGETPQGGVYRFAPGLTANFSTCASVTQPPLQAACAAIAAPASGGARKVIADLSGDGTEEISVLPSTYAGLGNYQNVYGPDSLVADNRDRFLMVFSGTTAFQRMEYSGANWLPTAMGITSYTGALVSAVALCPMTSINPSSEIVCRIGDFTVMGSMTSFRSPAPVRLCGDQATPPTGRCIRPPEPSSARAPVSRNWQLKVLKAQHL